MLWLRAAGLSPDAAQLLAVPGVRPPVLQRGRMPRPAAGVVTVRCYVCGRPATARVTITHTGGRTTRYAACDDHEPRHIPGGNVMVVNVEPIR